MEIKHRFSQTTLCSFEVETICECLESAVKDKVNLRGANLYGANLHEADLRGANLDGADLRRANLYGANLYGANLRGANLRRANLYEANLHGANLYGANLHEADLDGEILKQIPLTVANLHYWCLISDNYMRLGCKRFTHEEWANFTDEEIQAMDTQALEFWKRWKAPLLAMCAAHKGA
ncbi:MAG: pentapeptide repeat-containing protein [Azovibrio sp.]|uniref:pentapeptide repeat-containing protein n=1 Tax=Azovibrio sp. TaxID=1872673 RepID=UPI003C743314